MDNLYLYVGYLYLLYIKLCTLRARKTGTLFMQLFYSYLLQGGSAHRVQESVSEVRENETWKRVHKGDDTILLGRGQQNKGRPKNDERNKDKLNNHKVVEVVAVSWS